MKKVHGVLLMTLIIFGADYSSPFYTDNQKSNCLVLGEGPTDAINNSIGTAEKI